MSNIVKSSGNVFADLGFSADEAANLKVRAELLRAVQDAIAESGQSQKELAKRLDITQPRVSNLKQGRIDLFNTETLINFASLLGLQVEVSVKHAT